MYNVYMSIEAMCVSERLRDFHLALDETRTVIERVILPRPWEREPKCVCSFTQSHAHHDRGWRFYLWQWAQNKSTTKKKINRYGSIKILTEMQ